MPAGTNRLKMNPPESTFRKFAGPLPLALAAVFVLLAVRLADFPSPKVPGFRDGVHYYAPLFQYIFSELGQGRLPLWNPYENLGQPLAANPATMLFYPGLYLAGLPILCGADSLGVYTLFVAGHLILAVVTAYRLARHWKCSPEAAAVAGACYALGGNVLFQWNNVPFLVGAAWFPEALRLADLTIRTKALRPTVGLGVVAALMILGGDPQAAYHLFLCAGILLLCSGPNRETFLQTACLLALSGVITFCLAAVQILPAWEMGRLSDRSLEYHQSVIFLFSVPPWRLLEFLWPGAGGWQLPQNARWFSALPSGGGIWVPSFYMGLLPVLAALFVLLGRPWGRRKSSQAEQSLPPGLRTIFWVFLLGSLGKWCFVYSAFLLLPGYDSFRYPGKLLTTASLILAVLAAIGLDRVFQEEKMLRRFRWCVRAVVFAGAAGFLWLALTQFRFFGPVPACSLFGPFSPDTARSGVLMTVLVVLASFLIFEAACRNGVRRSVVLVVILADLLLANAWMLTTVPRDVHERVSPLLAAMERPDVPVRICRFPLWYPPDFKATSSPKRLVESAIWDRESLFPKHTLSFRVNPIDVRGTMMPKEYFRLAQSLRAGIREDTPEEFVSRLEQLGVRYVVAPENSLLAAERITLPAGGPRDVALWKLPDPAERQFLRYEPNRIVFEVSLEKPDTVVLTEQYWPGWHARLKGREIPIRPIDGVFRGVALPMGSHRVEMVYDPPKLRQGAMLTLFGLFVAGVLALKRKKPAGAGPAEPDSSRPDTTDPEKAIPPQK